jgi:hypothetical protein
MNLQQKLRAQDVSRAVAKKRLKQILIAFAKDEDEPADTDDILSELHIDLPQFSAQIAAMKHRLRLIDQVKTGDASYEKARAIEAEAEKERQQFHGVEVAWKQRRSELFRQREVYDSQVDAARHARVELAATADQDLIDAASKIETSLNDVRGAKHHAETRLQKARAVPPKGTDMFGYGGGESPGPDRALIAQLEKEIASLATKERELTEALKSARLELLNP